MPPLVFLFSLSVSSTASVPEQHRHHLTVEPSSWSIPHPAEGTRSCASAPSSSPSSRSCQDAFSPSNCRHLPHSRPSVAVAIHCLQWTSGLPDHSHVFLVSFPPYPIFFPSFSGNHRWPSLLLYLVRHERARARAHMQVPRLLPPSTVLNHGAPATSSATSGAQTLQPDASLDTLLPRCCLQAKSGRVSVFLQLYNNVQRFRFRQVNHPICTT
jgi:hypothetical protein